MKKLLLAGLLLLPLAAGAAPKQAYTPRFVSPELMESPAPLDWLWERHYQAGVSTSSDFRLTGRNELAVRLAYFWKSFGISGRISGFRARYGTFVPRADSTVDPTDPDLPMFADPSSEWNRPRGQQDLWTGLTYDLGLEFQTRQLAFLSPNLTQRIRWAVGRGTFHDVSNGLTFTPTYYRVELGGRYQLSLASPWAIEGGVSYSFGQLVKDADGPTSLRKLPLMWLDFSLGASLGF